MKIECRDGLLFVALTLEYEGRIHTVTDVVLDTGASQSLIDRDAVEPLAMTTGEDDVIVTMTGLGGPDYALRKQIDRLTFASHTVEKPYIDFGNLDAHSGINGLLGSDFLLPGRFVIDLDALEIYQKPKA